MSWATALLSFSVTTPWTPPSRCAYRLTPKLQVAPTVTVAPVQLLAVIFTRPLASPSRARGPYVAAAGAVTVTVSTGLHVPAVTTLRSSGTVLAQRYSCAT